MIFRNRLMRCTQQVNRYTFHFHNTATTRQFSGLLWCQLDQSPSCSEQKGLLFMNEDGNTSTLYGRLNYARTRSLPSPAKTIATHYGCEETDISVVEDQIRLNITYPWIAHR